MKTITLSFLMLFISSTTLFGIDYFWVGGTGNWSDYGTHWAISSGGGTFHAQAPTINDDVYFDASSFTLGSQSVTINAAAYCNNMNWTGAINTPDLAGTSSLEIQGSLTLIPAMTMTYSGSLYFTSPSTGQTITTAGQTFNGHVYFNGIGAWTLQDDFDIPGDNIYLMEGTLTTNNHDLNVRQFNTNYTGTRVLNLGTSTITINISSNDGFIFNGSNFTINPGTSLIKFTAYSGGMNYSGTGGVDFYDILSESTGGTSYIRNRGGTFHNITFNNIGYLLYGADINKVIFNSTGRINGSNPDFYTIDTVEFKAYADIFNGGHTLGRVSMDGNGKINGNNSINYLTLSEGHSYTFQSGYTTTINNEFNADGTCPEYIYLQSSTAGNQAIISKSSGTVTLSRIYLKDMDADPAATFTANSSIDLGNNTDWTIISPGTQTLYWVGNTGNWQDENNWSTISGGGGGACVPTILDNVIFDGGSFSGTGQTVSIDGDANGYALCNNMDWTNAGNNPSIVNSGNVSLRLYGSLTLISAMNWGHAWYTYFVSESSGNTIISDGQNFSNNIYFDGVSGEWTLTDNLDLSGKALYLVEGTLTTNNNDIFASYLRTRYSTTRVLNLGSSTITLSAGSSNAFDFNGTNLTINPGTSLIKFTGSNGGMEYNTLGGVDFYDILCENTTGTSYIRNRGGNFHDITFNNLIGRLHYGVNYVHKVTFNQTGYLYAGGTTYAGDIDTVEFNGSAIIDDGGWTLGHVFMAGNGQIDGTNTFDELLELSEGMTYTFQAGQTQTFNGDLTAAGTCFDPINIQSSTTSQSFFTKTSGIISVSRVNLAYMNASGGATYNAIDSYDLGNNSGWNISTPVSDDLYWVGDGGAWDDPTHWSTSSGGTGGACLPTLVDNVIFDDNSFSTDSQTVTLVGDGNNDVKCNSMTWTGSVTNTPTLSGAGTLKLRIYGSLTLTAGMNWSVSSIIHFHSQSAGNTVNSAGHTYLNDVHFDGNGGEWSLADDLDLSGEDLYLNEGTLTTNNHNIFARYFRTNYTTTRVLNLGSSTVTLTAGSSATFDFNGTNLTINPGTSLIKFTGSGGGMEYHTTGAVDFYDILCENTAGTSYIRNRGGNFHDITFNSTTGRLVYGGYAHKVTFNNTGFIYKSSGVNFNIDTVIFNGSGTIDDGGHTFGDVYMYGTGKIDGSNTFDYLEFSPGFTYTLQYGQTQTIINDLVADGSCSQAITIQSSSAGNATTISKASGTITIRRVNLSDNTATGGATFNASGCTFLGGNTNWNLTPIDAQDLYWVGGTGNWNDINHWAGSSGGPGGYCLPTSIDNVFFDANSFDNINQVVYVNVTPIEVNDMTWSGVLNHPGFSSPNTYSMLLNGSLQLDPNMNYAYNGNVTFQSTSIGNTLNTNGLSFTNNVYFNGVGGGWTLLSNTGSTGTTSLSVTNGLIDLGSYLYESSGTTIIDGGTLKLSDNSLLEVGSGDSIVVRSGGTLEVLGSAGNEATIKGYNNQNYTFRVRSGGTISAEHASFKHMDDKGLYVMDGATINATHHFDNCSFEGGSLVGDRTVLTIDNNQTLTIDQATFPHNTWNGLYNVAKNLNQGHLTFTNASGNFAGVIFENDSHGLIDWPGLTAGEWTGYKDELWSDNANWMYHYEPDTAVKHTIPGSRPNYPKVTSVNEPCNALEVQAGAELWINNSELTVTNDATFHGQLKMDDASGKLNIGGDMIWTSTSEEHTDGITNGEINLDGDLYLNSGNDVDMGAGNTMNLNNGGGKADCYIYSNEGGSSLGTVNANCDTYYDGSSTQALHINGDLNILEDFFAEDNELIIDGDLHMFSLKDNRATGKLTVYPAASVTAGGNVHIETTDGIEIQANTGNTGSFIGNSDYTYAIGAGIKISTYFFNNASSGYDFHYHLTGTMVDDPGTAFQGVELSAFNLITDETYAYKYDNAGDDWVNIHQLTDPINSTEGILLTTNNNTSYYLDMSGEFNTGNASGVLNTASLPVNYSLLANPYSSAIDFDEFFNTNSSTIGLSYDFYYVWQSM